MAATDEQNAAFLEHHPPARAARADPGASAAGCRRAGIEVAFGHRRLRAARDLGVPVRAVVRAISDDELVVAQGQENSGRTDLTFIERARFAARLEDADFSRETIMAALTVDKTDLSRLIAIATRIPGEIVEAIGPAPGIGRPRWQDLSDLLREAAQRTRAARIAAEPDFAKRTSDGRFETLLARLRKAPARGRRPRVFRGGGRHAGGSPRGRRRPPDGHLRRPGDAAVRRLRAKPATGPLRRLEGRRAALNGGPGTTKKAPQNERPGRPSLDVALER